MAHRKFGKLPWADVVRPAARLASRGFPLSKDLAASLNSAVEKFMAPFPSSVAAYGKPAWRSRFWVAALARGTFFFEQALQEIGVAHVLRGGTVQPLHQDASCLLQAEVLQQSLQAAGGSRGHAHGWAPAVTGANSSVRWWRGSGVHK